MRRGFSGRVHRQLGRFLHGAHVCDSRIRGLQIADRAAGPDQKLPRAASAGPSRSISSRSDRHYTNQKWLRRDFGDKLPSDVFREHSLACYVTDKTSLKLRREIGIDNIAWECDYPHSDCFWPDAPEQVLAELTAAGADDGDINKITWENACNFFSWDPFARTPRAQLDHGPADVGRFG